MQNRQLHKWVSVLVLCCYFMALTPLHVVAHYVESLFCKEVELIQNKAEHGHVSSEVPSDCAYCHFINYEGANVFLLSPSVEVHFLPLYYLANQLFYYKAPSFISFLGAFISLRAPPAL